MGGGDEEAGGAEGLGEDALVDGVCVGVEEADGYGLDLVGARAAIRRAARRGEGFEDGAGVGEALVDAEGEGRVDEGARGLDEEVVEAGAGLAAYAEDVLEAGGG